MTFTHWRPNRPHESVRYRAPAPAIPATKFFDNLSFIGNRYVGCFLLETDDGFILLDNMCMGDAPYIEKGIINLGFDPKDLKHILITHGHSDHYGDAEYFRRKFGTKLWMSKIDEDFAHDPAKQVPPGNPPMDYRMDGYLEDGMIFSWGGAEVECLFTPGHTPGCMSFMFEVYDEGRVHVCAQWGGTGAPREPEQKKTHLESFEKYCKRAAERGVDVNIASHPFVDNAALKYQIVREIVDGVPNPFVLGFDGYHRFEQMLRDSYMKSLSEPPREKPKNMPKIVASPDGSTDLSTIQ